MFLLQSVLMQLTLLRLQAGALRRLVALLYCNKTIHQTSVQELLVLLLQIY